MSQEIVAGPACLPHRGGVEERRTESATSFQVRQIDDEPGLLGQSYALRYQVYCLERGFLPAAHYPAGLETDEFDGQSLHFGAFDAEGRMAATARLVCAGTHGLPLYRYCRVFFDESRLDRSTHMVAEISRLAVSRHYRRRETDGGHDRRAAAPQAGAEPRPERRERRRGKELMVTINEAIYEASTQLGVTHWLAAMELPLQRLLATYGFPFEPIGPEIDYFGHVAPFIMELKAVGTPLTGGPG